MDIFYVSKFAYTGIIWRLCILIDCRPASFHLWYSFLPFFCFLLQSSVVSRSVQQIPISHSPSHCIQATNTTRNSGFNSSEAPSGGRDRTRRASEPRQPTPTPFQQLKPYYCWRDEFLQVPLVLIIIMPSPVRHGRCQLWSMIEKAMSLMMIRFKDNDHTSTNIRTEDTIYWSREKSSAREKAVFILPPSHNILPFYERGEPAGRQDERSVPE